MRVFVEFTDAASARSALGALVSLGYLDAETHGPFPLTDEDAHAPRSSFPLAFLGLGAALSGMAAAFLIQWYANVRSYPLNIGGRPAYAAPAFVPATFETICVCAAVALFLGFLVLERLPRPWQPLFEIDGFDRASVDRFWIAVSVRDGADVGREVQRDILPLRPVRVVAEETLQ